MTSSIQDTGSESSLADGVFSSSPVSQLDIGDTPSSDSLGSAADMSKSHSTLDMPYDLVLLTTSGRGGKMMCKPGEF